MPVTYNGHADAGARAFNEVVPIWQGGARRYPLDSFRELPINPSGVSAAGTDLSGATTLNANYDIHEITVVPTTGVSGVKFAPLSSFSGLSRVKIIRCAGSPTNSNIVRLYPSATGKLNDQAVGGWFTIEPGISLMLYSTSAVDWKTIP